MSKDLQNIVGLFVGIGLGVVVLAAYLVIRRRIRRSGMRAARDRNVGRGA